MTAPRARAAAWPHKCGTCLAPVIRAMGDSGRWSRFDLEPDPDHGRWVLATADGELLERPSPFATVSSRYATAEERTLALPLLGRGTRPLWTQHECPEAKRKARRR